MMTTFLIVIVGGIIFTCADLLLDVLFKVS